MDTKTYATSADTANGILKADRLRWMSRARPDFVMGMGIMAAVLVVIVMLHFVVQRQPVASWSMVQALALGLALCGLLAAVFTWFTVGPWPTQRAMTANVEIYRQRMMKADARVRTAAADLKLFRAPSRRLESSH